MTAHSSPETPIKLSREGLYAQELVHAIARGVHVPPEMLPPAESVESDQIPQGVVGAGRVSLRAATAEGALGHALTVASEGLPPPIVNGNENTR